MKKLIRKFLILLPFLILHGSTFAADASNNNSPAGISSGSLARYVLGGVIVLLGFVIFILTNAIKIAGQNYQDKIKAEKNGAGKILSIILLLSMFSNSLFAQTEANTKNFASNWDLYILMLIVLVLFIVILVMVKTLFILMGIKAKEKEQKLGGFKVKTFFQKFNETVPIEEEESLDLSHDYDGIRELDNKIPSWWTWAFFSFVLFAIVYLYRMFVTETLPNQYVELAKANEIAAEQKLEFLKNSANNVDENSVVFLGAGDIAQGAEVYAKNCVACHGDKGQGMKEETRDDEVLPAIPALAGQVATYTYKQLRDYLSGSRSHVQMTGVAKGLSEQDAADLAVWFSSLPRAANKSGSEKLARAEKMVEQGDGKRILPPCFVCHGSKGQGEKQDIPALAGQQANYFTRTLLDYKTGQRHNDVYSRMRLIAQQLSEDEIKELAQYYQQLK